MKSFPVFIYLISLIISIGMSETRIYDHEGIGYIYDISSCDDGILIPTQRDMHPGRNWSPFALRVDSNGDTLWSFSSDPTADRDCYVCGAELANGEIILIQDSDWIYYMIKLSSTGDSITSMELPDTIADWAYDICAAPDTGFYLFCDYETLGIYHPKVIKYTSDFEFVWSASPSGLPVGPDNGAARSGGIAPNGDIVCGVAKTGTTSWMGIWCLDSLGNHKWIKGENLGVVHDFADFSITPEGNYGYIYTDIYGPSDIITGFIRVFDADSHTVFSNQITVPYSSQNRVVALTGMPGNYWWVMGTAHNGTDMTRFFQLLSPTGTVVELDTMNSSNPRYYDMTYQPEMGFVKCGIQDSRIYLEWQKPLELELLSPHGGELWFAEDTQNVLWSSRNIDSLEIRFSTNAGVSWEIAVSSTPSDGSYPWVLPDVYSTECLVKLVCSADTTCQSQSESYFTIDTTSEVTKSLDLIAPNGDTLLIGFHARLLWNNVHVDSISIEYSRDNGASWEFVETTYPTESCSYDWVVPPGHTNYGLIRISDITDVTIFDVSDDYFFVEYSWPWIEVLSPRGGDTLITDDTVDVMWTYGNLGFSTEPDFFVNLSTNSGTSWVNILATTDTVFEWVVPDLVSDFCMIAVTTTDSFAGDTVSRFRPMDEDLVYGMTGIFSIVDSLLGIHETKPETFELFSYPNPFNSAVSISTPEGAKVEIFDVLGQSVDKLPGGEQIWKPEPSVGSGIYLFRATVNEHEVTKRVVYLK